MLSGISLDDYHFEAHDEVQENNNLFTYNKNSNQGKCFFANKFDVHSDARAVKCLHEYLTS